MYIILYHTYQKYTTLYHIYYNPTNKQTPSTVSYTVIEIKEITHYCTQYYAMHTTIYFNINLLHIQWYSIQLYYCIYLQINTFSKYLVYLYNIIQHCKYKEQKNIQSIVRCLFYFFIKEFIQILGIKIVPKISTLSLHLYPNQSIFS